MLGTKILSGLLLYIMAFSRSFQGGVQITDKILLKLDLGLQGFFKAVVLIVPGLVAPSLAIPALWAPGLAVPGMVAPSGVIPGLVAPHGKVSRSVHQVSLVVGIDAWIFYSC